MRSAPAAAESPQGSSWITGSRSPTGRGGGGSNLAFSRHTSRLSPSAFNAAAGPPPAGPSDESDASAFHLRPARQRGVSSPNSALAEVWCLGAISLPFVTESLLAALLSTIDTVFVGQILGASYLAAAALGNAWFNMCYCIMTGGCMAVQDECEQSIESTAASTPSDSQGIRIDGTQQHRNGDLLEDGALDADAPDGGGQPPHTANSNDAHASVARLLRVLPLPEWGAWLLRATAKWTTEKVVDAAVMACCCGCRAARGALLVRQRSVRGVGSPLPSGAAAFFAAGPGPATAVMAPTGAAAPPPASAPLSLLAQRGIVVLALLAIPVMLLLALTEPILVVLVGADAEGLAATAGIFCGSLIAGMLPLAVSSALTVVLKANQRLVDAQQQQEGEAGAAAVLDSLATGAVLGQMQPQPHRQRFHSGGETDVACVDGGGPARESHSTLSTTTARSNGSTTAMHAHPHTHHLHSPLQHARRALRSADTSGIALTLSPSYRSVVGGGASASHHAHHHLDHHRAQQLHHQRHASGDSHGGGALVRGGGRANHSISQSASASLLSSATTRAWAPSVASEQQQQPGHGGGSSNNPVTPQLARMHSVPLLHSSSSSGSAATAASSRSLASPAAVPVFSLPVPCRRDSIEQELLLPPPIRALDTGGLRNNGCGVDVGPLQRQEAPSLRLQLVIDTSRLKLGEGEGDDGCDSKGAGPAPPLSAPIPPPLYAALTWHVIFISALANLVNVVLNAALINVDGFLGAPLATSLSRMLQLVMLGVYVVAWRPFAWTGWDLSAALLFGEMRRMLRRAAASALAAASESWVFDVTTLLVVARVLSVGGGGAPPAVAPPSSAVSGAIATIDAHCALIMLVYFLYVGAPMGFAAAAANRIPSLLQPSQEEWREGEEGEPQQQQQQQQPHWSTGGALASAAGASGSEDQRERDITSQDAAARHAATATAASAAAHCARVAILSGVVSSVACAGVMLATRHSLGALFTSDPVVKSVVSAAAPLAALYVLLDGVTCTCAGVLRGAGAERLVSLISALSWWAVGLPLALLLSSPSSAPAAASLAGGGRGAWEGEAQQLAGVWVGMLAANASQALLFMALVARVRWGELALQAAEEAEEAREDNDTGGGGLVDATDATGREQQGTPAGSYGTPNPVASAGATMAAEAAVGGHGAPAGAPPSTTGRPHNHHPVALLGGRPEEGGGGGSSGSSPESVGRPVTPNGVSHGVATRLGLGGSVAKQRLTPAASAAVLMSLGGEQPGL